jgi:hypothetical protein
MVLLPNRKVLLFGGSTTLAGAPINRAELFDPATRSWSTTGSSAGPHCCETPVVLRSGRVLAVSRAPELYEPGTGTWRAAAANAFARDDVTATLLLNGRALIVGGAAGGAATTGTQELDEWSGAEEVTAAPVLNALPSVLQRGQTFTITGQRLTVRGEGSTGSFAGVATNRPLLQLEREGNGLRTFLPLTSWTSTQATARVPQTLQPGPYQGRLIVGGLSSRTTPAVVETLPFGAPCTAGSACYSGFCVDGVCCNSACGGGSSDCQACSVAQGAAVDGTCGPRASGTTCRASTGVCDAAEACNGSATTCPADAPAASTTVCRTSTDLCDPDDFCDGVSFTCPPNAPAAASTVCRPSTDPCDPADSCDGVSFACPVDVPAPATTVCRASVGPCDPEDSCDGVSLTCPMDAPAPATTVCRTAVGSCDVTESCDGLSFTCPADAKVPDTSSCGLGGTCSAGVCSCEALIVENAPATGAVGSAYAFDVVVQGTGQQAVTFGSCSVNPPGFELDSATGAVSWTPTSAGTFSICLEASTPSCGSDQYAFSVTVEAQPPSPLRLRVGCGCSSGEGSLWGLVFVLVALKRKKGDRQLWGMRRR